MPFAGFNVWSCSHLCKTNKQLDPPLDKPLLEDIICFPHPGACSTAKQPLVWDLVCVQQEEQQKKHETLLLVQLSTIRPCEALLGEVMKKPMEI